MKEEEKVDYCPQCKEMTQQTKILYDPDNEDAGHVWYCDSCQEEISWVENITQ